MQTQGASNLWGSGLSGLETNWGLGTPYSSGANMSLLGYGSNSLSNNQGHMQSGASSVNDTVNSNPTSGNRAGGWGPPGTAAPSPSTTNRVPTSSSGHMQGSLPVSGAQPNGPQSSQQQTSQSPGPNSALATSQGNSAFGNGNNATFQKGSSSASSGLGINPPTSIMNSNNGNAQNSDNLDSPGWGSVPSSIDNSRLMGSSNWGNPSGADWDQPSTSMSQQSQSQLPPSASQNSNPNMGAQSNPADQQRPSSWAQAAGKGLNLNNNPGAGASGNTPSPEELQRQAQIRMAIESHEGWGKKPVRQDTQWSIETSPKVQRKFSTASVLAEQPKGTNNMWNNNNGTAIWEANKDNMPAWNSNVGRAPGPPSNWNGASQKPPDPNSSQWGAGGPGQAPGQNKGMTSWGAPPEGNQSSNNSNWGGSTETGSWGGNFNNAAPGSGSAGGMNTWGERDNASGWGDNQRAGSDGNPYWGEPKPPTQQPPNWSAPGSGNGGPTNQQQQAIGQNRGGNKMGSGWGDPIGQPDPKIDDGTSLWAANNQQQARAAGWGDTTNQGQWNPAIGKPKSQITAQNAAQFGGVDELNWNFPKEGAMNMKFPGGVNQPPQMRIRCLQQLMDMGFKKDEAQHALITNNMNLQNALTDLYSRRGKKEGDMDGWMDGSKPRMPSGFMQDGNAQDDISDTQDSNSFVPNLNPMQNTPFNNAQPKIPNQFSFNGPSLNTSSLNPNNPSINPALQQKIIQKFQQQPPPPTPQSMNSINPSQGPMGRGQLPTGQQNSAVHHMAQQQILQQLRMAVQAGLISPQLLNQQLPSPVLVMLQQLLQQQQSLQQLITTQQVLQQPKVGLNPLMQRQQLEQVAARINSIKQQILLLQKNISQAQNNLLNKTSQAQQPPQHASPETTEANLQSEMNSLTISTSQPQSRLNQWKKPDKESPNSATTPTSTAAEEATTTTSTTTSAASSDAGSESDPGSLNKTVGSKPIQNSNSTPNLRRYDELGLGQIGGDTTWSTTPTSAPSQSWPNTSTPPAASGADEAGDKESLSSTAGTTTTTGSSSVLDSIPAIPEFVPGKPWQGISKNVEDDPHITPGSFARSLSVNTIKDDYLFTLNTKPSPTNDTTSSWPPKPSISTSQSINKPWSTGDSSNFTSEVWGVPMGSKGGMGGMSRPPPGLPQQQKQQQSWSGMNRQHSWAGGASRSDGSWDSRPQNVSSALVLKNLTPQIDGSTLRTLCMQHGPLQCFYLNLAHGQALVKYRTTEEAYKAQKSLNICLLGNTTIVAEFVSDSEAVRFVEQQSAMSSGPGQWSQVGNSRNSAVGANNQRQPDLGMSSWGMTPPASSSSLTGTGMWGGMSTQSGGALWEPDLDNSAHNLLGNMLGENM